MMAPPPGRDYTEW